MLGGTYLAGRSSQRASYRESDQEQRLEQLEAQQPAPPAPAPAAAPASGGDDMVSKLKQLAELKSSGVLSEEEFQAAKAKLLAS
jgi:hypothetical protein